MDITYTQTHTFKQEETETYTHSDGELHAHTVTTNLHTHTVTNTYLVHTYSFTHLLVKLLQVLHEVLVETTLQVLPRVVGVLVVTEAAPGPVSRHTCRGGTWVSSHVLAS